MTPEWAQFLGALLAIAGVWWRVEGMIRSNTDDLASHKLHVAETYTTKAGMQEQTAQIMKALDGVSSKIDYTNGRLDTFTQLKPSPRSRS